MIDDKTTETILKLCRFRLNDEEKQHFQTEITAILSYMEMLGEVDTSHIDPDLGKALLPGDFRADLASTAPGLKDLETLTPHFENRYFMVPRILEGMEELGQEQA
jgi:aspartyl-tRNA(Asn)/glutamyl-tRNA(Gln) amidotransferase subunit C